MWTMDSLQQHCIRSVFEQLGDDVYNSSNWNEERIVSVSHLLHSLFEPAAKPAGSSRLSLLSLAVIHTSELKELRFCDYFWCCKECDVSLLPPALASSFPALESLHFNEVKLSDYGVCSIGMNMPHLISLDLSNCTGVGVHGWVALDSCGLLSSLNLESCHIVFDEWPLGNCRKLSQLRLGGNVLQMKALRTLTETSGPSLQQLSIWGCECLGRIEDELCLMHCDQLDDLDLRSVRPLSSEFSSVILRNLTRLKLLNCEGADIGESIVRDLAVSSEDKLQELHLTSCPLSAASLEIFGRHFVALQILCLAYIDFSAHSSTEIWSFHNLSSLVVLDLNHAILPASTIQQAWLADAPSFPVVSHSSSDDVSEDRVATVQPRLLFPSRLRALDLNYSQGISDEAATSIAVLTELKSLRLAGMCFTPANWAKLLGSKPKLQELDVTGCDLTISRLLDSLQDSRKKLKFLYAGGLKLTKSSPLVVFSKLEAAVFPTSWFPSVDEATFASMFPVMRSSRVCSIPSQPGDSSIKAAVEGVSLEASNERKAKFDGDLNSLLQILHDRQRSAQPSGFPTIEDILSARTSSLAQFPHPGVVGVPGVTINFVAAAKTGKSVIVNE